MPTDYLSVLKSQGGDVADKWLAAYKDSLQAVISGADFVSDSKSPQKVSRSIGDKGAFIWSCNEWDQNGTEPITMLINPESMSWTIPVRVTRTNVFGGTVFHRWQNLKGNSTDLYKVKFKFNTGNILPVGFVESARREVAAATQSGGVQGISASQMGVSKPSTTAKSDAFLKFCQLFHTPAFTTGSQEPNIVSVQFQTPLLTGDAATGGVVTLYMIFTDPLTFSEDAKNPFNVVYEVEGTVIDMLPRLFSPEPKPSGTDTGEGVISESELSPDIPLSRGATQDPPSPPLDPPKTTEAGFTVGKDRVYNYDEKTKTWRFMTSDETYNQNKHWWQRKR